MKHFRRVVILIFIMAVCFAMMAPGSFAMGPNAFKAWIAAALTAAQITVDSTLPVVAPVEDFLINPFNITDTVMDYVEYSYPFLPDSASTSPRESLAEYMEREGTIVVRGDTITIDGIDYTDIWVDNDAAQALRTNVLDIETAWNIASNSSGKFVSGVGSISGLPLFDIGGLPTSQNYIAADPSVTYSTAGFNYYYNSTQEGNYTRYTGYLINSSGISRSVSYLNNPPSYGLGTPSVFHAYIKDSSVIGVLSNPNTQYHFSTTNSNPLSYYDYDSTPFDFTWVSQNIPAEVLSADEGLHILVPNNPVQFADNTVKQNITNFNNNLTFSPDVSIQMSDPGIMDALDLLMDTIHTLIDLTKPSFGPYEDIPVPPVDPDSISNTPWSELQTRIDNILSQLGDIASSIGDITGQIVNGDRRWFKDVVDSISVPFAPIISIFQSVVGIWRYVVSWIGNISAPFSWSLSSLGSAGSIFLSPLYAAFAAAVVIAIYRRFGR